MALTISQNVLGQRLLLLALLLTTSASCSIFAQSPLASGEPLAEARIKDKNEEIQLREDITDYAQVHMGTKYRSAGKTASGFDCSGFVYHVMKTFDIRMASCAATQERQGRKVSIKDAQPGDLVFFRRTKGGRVFHVSMVLSNEDGDTFLIHSTNRGVVIDRLKESSYWRTKIKTVRSVVN